MGPFGWGAWMFQDVGSAGDSAQPQEGTMSVNEATSKCASTVGCKGFVVQGNFSDSLLLPVSFKKSWYWGKAQSECDSLCRMTTEQYQSLEICSFEHSTWWQEKAAVDRRGKCDVEAATGQVVCKDGFKCKGGKRQSVYVVNI